MSWKNVMSALPTGQVCNQALDTGQCGPLADAE
jgi:hypothetical protein